MADDKRIETWDEFTRGVVLEAIKGLEFHVTKYDKLIELGEKFRTLHPEDPQLVGLRNVLTELKEHTEAAVARASSLLAIGAN